MIGISISTASDGVVAGIRLTKRSASRITYNGISSSQIGFGCNTNAILLFPRNIGRRYVFVPISIAPDICVVNPSSEKAFVPVIYPITLFSFTIKSLTISDVSGGRAPKMLFICLKYFPLLKRLRTPAATNLFKATISDGCCATGMEKSAGVITTPGFVLSTTFFILSAILILVLLFHQNVMLIT